MEKRTERDPYEDRPQEVRRGATGQVSDGMKPMGEGWFPTPSKVNTLPQLSCWNNGEHQSHPLTASCKVTAFQPELC